MMTNQLKSYYEQFLSKNDNLPDSKQIGDTVYKKVKAPPIILKQSCEYDTNGKKKQSAQGLSNNKHTHS